MSVLVLPQSTHIRTLDTTVLCLKRDRVIGIQLTFRDPVQKIPQNLQTFRMTPGIVYLWV